MKASLAQRLLITALVILVAFLGLAALALESAYRQSLETALEERLKTYIYALLADADEDASGKLVMPPSLSTPGFNQTDSGLLAQIISNDNKYEWVSTSSLGVMKHFINKASPGEVRHRSDGNFQIIDYGIAWEDADGKLIEYTLSVAQDRTPHEQQVSAFRTSLAWWLGGSGTLLLLIQFVLIRWGLRPLHSIARQVKDIEGGKSEKLEGTFPAELVPLTDNLNALIHHTQLRQERTRNSLADLAHSLKTPLAVMNASINEIGNTEQQSLLYNQLERIDEIISYQREKASVAGTSLITKFIDILPVIERINKSLQKAYAVKNIGSDIKVRENLRLKIDEGDLYELLGNLMDNAYKHAKSSIRIQAVSSDGNMNIYIEDDGPGIEPKEQDRILNRGERADEQYPGQGIGLSVVNEIVRQYQGSLDLGRSELGGLKTSINFNK